MRSVSVLALFGMAEDEGGLLGVVRARGELMCGVSAGVVGFSVVDDTGGASGFDVDFCRAIAVAVLGDATALKYVELTAAARFQALADGSIDVLVRNTTWTQSRDLVFERLVW